MNKRFAIALSFPGERRDFVAQVAECLAEQVGRERVLYDSYYEAEFARPDLDTHLQRLYHDESTLIAVFLCAEYERKDWCGLEWRALRDLIKRRQSDSIMPLRFDNTEIPGLFSTDGYVWIGAGRARAEIAGVIYRRWQLNQAQADPDPDPPPEPSADPDNPFAPGPPPCRPPSWAAGRSCANWSWRHGRAAGCRWSVSGAWARHRSCGPGRRARWSRGCGSVWSPGRDPRGPDNGYWWRG